MPILTDYERTYSAPHDEIGSTTDDQDYDESDRELNTWDGWDYLDTMEVNFNEDNNPSDTETL